MARAQHLFLIAALCTGSAAWQSQRIGVVKQHAKKVKIARAVSSSAGGATRIVTLREMFRFTLTAIPIFIAPTLLSLIDTAAVGQKSSLELAAMGPACAVVDTISGFFVFVSVGATNAAARASDLGEKARAATVGVILGAALGAAAGIVAFAACGPGSFASLGELQLACSRYIRIRALAMPATVALMAAQASCLGVKDSESPARATALASLVNVIGDAVLVPPFGIAGAAWATVLCQYVACAACVKALKTNKMLVSKLSAITPSEIADFFAFGGFMIVVLFKSITYNQAVVLAATLGPVSSAAHQVIYSLSRFCFALGDTTGATAQAYLPPALRDPHAAAQICRKVCIMAACVATLASTLTLAAPTAAPFLFTRDTTVQAAMRAIAPAAGMGLLLHPLVVGLEGCLLARNDLGWLVGNYCCTGFLSVLATLALARFSSLSLSHVWLYLAGYQLIRFLFFCHRTFVVAPIPSTRSLSS